MVEPAVNGDLAGGCDCVAASGGGVGEVGFGLGGMTGPTFAVRGGGGPGLGAGGPTGTLVTRLLLPDCCWPGTVDPLDPALKMFNTIEIHSFFK